KLATRARRAVPHRHATLLAESRGAGRKMAGSAFEAGRMNARRAPRRCFNGKTRNSENQSRGHSMTRTFRTATLTLLGVAAAMPAWAQSQPAPKYSAKVPPFITTPDTVQTRIGTLKFFDGLPDQETVQKVYDNLDFTRGVEAFLSGIPAAALYAACEGLNQIGVKPN